MSATEGRCRREAGERTFVGAAPDSPAPCCAAADVGGTTMPMEVMPFGCFFFGIEEASLRFNEATSCCCSAGSSNRAATTVFSSTRRICPVEHRSCTADHCDSSSGSAAVPSITCCFISTSRTVPSAVAEPVGAVAELVSSSISAPMTEARRLPRFTSAPYLKLNNGSSSTGVVPLSYLIVTAAEAVAGAVVVVVVAESVETTRPLTLVRTDSSSCCSSVAWSPT